MTNYNHVVLVGRVVKDGELKQSNSNARQTSFCRFVLAVNRSYKAEKYQQTDFIPIVVWGKYAEKLKPYIEKGNLLLVEGIIQVQEYENKQDQKDWYTQVNAEKIQVISRASNKDSVSSESRQKELVGA